MAIGVPLYRWMLLFGNGKIPSFEMDGLTNKHSQKAQLLQFANWKITINHHFEWVNTNYFHGHVQVRELQRFAKGSWIRTYGSTTMVLGYTDIASGIKHRKAGNIENQRSSKSLQTNIWQDSTARNCGTPFMSKKNMESIGDGVDSYGISATKGG